MTLPAHQCLLPYADRLDARPASSIELVVIHCTELPDLATARDYGLRELYPASGTGNSGHFYIDRDGHLEQWVPLERVAHHVRGHNRNSIGIELVNSGRWPHWLDSRHQTMAEAYPTAQVDALLALLRQLVETLPALRWIAGHDQLDTTWVEASDDPARTVRRKQDPGPLFPWPHVLAASGLVRLESTDPPTADALRPQRGA